MSAIAKIAKNRICYECKKCDYTTCNKYDYDKHQKTIKHLSNDLAMFSINLSQKSQAKSFTCKDCNKDYKDYSGLWRHKKKCNLDIKNVYAIKSDSVKNNLTTDKDLVVMLIKQNSELIKDNIEYKNMVMEVIKNGTNNTTHTNSHNKTFNLQFFLNETCKDAMNIMDFVDSIKLQLTDLEKVGKIGYVEGISNIIVENLKALDVSERPIHCTDKKREVLYIKDEDKWEKEDDEKKMIRKAIKKVANKNSRLLPQFKEMHPDCGKSDSLFSDQYNKLIIESMGGSGDNDVEKEDKIIRNIVNNVTIDK